MINPKERSLTIVNMHDILRNKMWCITSYLGIGAMKVLQPNRYSTRILVRNLMSSTTHNPIWRTLSRNLLSSILDVLRGTSMIIPVDKNCLLWSIGHKWKLVCVCVWLLGLLFRIYLPIAVCNDNRLKYQM